VPPAWVPAAIVAEGRKARENLRGESSWEFFASGGPYILGINNVLGRCPPRFSLGGCSAGSRGFSPTRGHRAVASSRPAHADRRRHPVLSARRHGGRHPANNTTRSRVANSAAAAQEITKRAPPPASRVPGVSHPPSSPDEPCKFNKRQAGPKGRCRSPSCRTPVTDARASTPRRSTEVDLCAPPGRGQ